jgi:peptidoglycan/LPS O-acetylase OafA/YrhL
VPRSLYSHVPAAFAGLTGIALIAWWAATLLGAPPTGLQPAQQQASHVVAELALGVALLAGSWLDLRGARPARLVLGAALGGLVYASVNVLGDFPGSLVMTVLLAGTVALSVATLIAVLLGSGSD